MLKGQRNLMKSARYKYIRQMSAKVQKTLKEPRRYSIITYNNVNKYNTTVSVTQHHQSTPTHQTNHVTQKLEAAHHKFQRRIMGIS